MNANARHRARRRYRLVAVLLLVMPSLAGATEDLLSQYRLALHADPRLLAAAANRDAVAARRAEARAGFFPTVAATVSRNKNNETVATQNFIFSQPAGHAVFYNNEYRLTLSQPLYYPESAAAYRAAGADLRQAQAQYAAAYQTLIVRVAQAYFDALLARDTLSFANAEKSALAEQLDSAKGRLEGGLAPITDVHDAEAGFQNAVSDVISAENQLADKREALAEITGRLPGALAGLGETFRFVMPEPPDIRQWTRAAAARNPQIAAAAAAVDSARDTIAQNRAGGYPTVDLVGSLDRSRADASVSGPGVLTDNTVVGIQLKVPIYQGGLIGARTREAAYRYEAAQQELEARRRNVERTTRSAFQAVTGGMAKIEALQQTVTAAAASLAAKREGYHSGLYTSLDVLNATRDLYRAKRDLAEARYTYAVALLQLKQAAGTLSEKDLAAANGWLRE